LEDAESTDERVRVLSAELERRLVSQRIDPGGSGEAFARFLARTRIDPGDSSDERLRLLYQRFELLESRRLETVGRTGPGAPEQGDEGVVIAAFDELEVSLACEHGPGGARHP
jgi:hypothetical protein